MGNKVVWGLLLGARLFWPCEAGASLEGDLTAFSAASQNDGTGGVYLAWNYQDFANAGILIVRSSSPITFQPQANTVYFTGQSTSGAVVVYNSLAWVQEFADRDLNTFTTYYYRAYLRNSVPEYGIAFNAQAYSLPAFDALAPEEVGGLALTRSADQSLVTISWKGVSFNADSQRSSLRDLNGYEILRSTTLGSGMAVIAALDAQTTSYTEAAIPGVERFYSVRAVDFSGNRSDSAVILEDGETTRVWIIRGAACLQIEGVSARSFFEASRTSGDLVDIEVRRIAQEETGNVLRSFEISARRRGGAQVQHITFDPREFKMIFSYAQAAFPSAQFGLQRKQSTSTHSTSSGQASLRAGAATISAGVYWFNGMDWIALQGSADEDLKTVSVPQSQLGRFQVRLQATPQGFDLSPSDVRPRIFSPNGDGKNDFVTFTFRKGAGVEVSGKILDLSGAFVASVNEPGPVAGNSLRWDGRDSGGNPAPAGIYVYKIEGAGETAFGRIVLAR